MKKLETAFLSLQELIKNMKVKKFSAKNAEQTKVGAGGGIPKALKRPEEGHRIRGLPTTTATATAATIILSPPVEKSTPSEVKKETEPSDKKQSSSCLYQASMQIVGLVEKGCGNWGKTVVSHPFMVTSFCLMIATCCALGLLNLYSELRPYKLWIPHQSEFAKVNEWKTENFPSTYRRHNILWEAKNNILTADTIKEMWKLHQNVVGLSVSVNGEDNITWEDVCTRVPSLLAKQKNNTLETEDYGDYPDYSYYNTTWPPLNWTAYDYNYNVSSNWTTDYDYYDYNDTDYLAVGNLTEDEKKILNSVPEEVLQTVRDDHSLSLTRVTYCELLEEKPNLCYETSLLEVWGYDNEVIMNLTDEKVLQDINKAYMSNVYGYPTEYDKYLGGIERDDEDNIISAKATLHSWTTKIRKNKTTVIDLGSGDVVDEGGMMWETALVKEARSVNVPGVKLHVHAAHSFGAVSSATIMDDVKWVVCGWIALAVYVLVTLGHPGPAIVGLFCVAVAVGATYGLGSLIGVPYGPINSVLPVLLIGLGVDDMYVIVAAWEASASILSIEAKAREALKHAGVAVTVTSMTDAVAFLVGATTQVPALRWFCIYAAIGVSAVYCLQCTVFVAALSVEQRYMDNHKTKCCNASKKTKWSLHWVMKSYSQVITFPFVQIGVLITALLILGIGAWGAANLRQEFSPIWFLPRSSYLYQWFTSMDTHFPTDGERGTVYFSNVTLPEEMPALRELASSLRESPYISKVDAWFNVLDVYLYENGTYEGQDISSDTLHNALSIFLNSKSGAEFRSHFRFEEDLTCEESAPPFSVFKVEFQYARLDNRADQQAAMVNVREVVASANLSGYHAAWAHVYSQWETDSALGFELWRNLGIVVVVVATTTLLLLAAARAAFLVLLSVLATLVDVTALMHVWGLTIDTVTCIALVLAIGICVDYSAHVAHAFLVVGGTKKERAQTAVAGVGTAVLHGGISTLLAFILLCPSDSHLFQSFFKIFTGVSIMGLFHGLVLLPVLLSLIGPEPYPDLLEHGPQLTMVVVEQNKDSNANMCDKSATTNVKKSHSLRGAKYKKPMSENGQICTIDIKTNSSMQSVENKLNSKVENIEESLNSKNISQTIKRLTM